MTAKKSLPLPDPAAAVASDDQPTVMPVTKPAVGKVAKPPSKSDDAKAPRASGLTEVEAIPPLAAAAPAGEELAHALLIAKQIDYLGGNPTVTPQLVKTSEKAEEMLRFDLDNENETIANYRVRVRQCEAMGEYAIAENIRQILVQEQEHQIDLATALGVDVPDVSRPDQRA